VGTRRISRRGVLATALAAGVAGSVHGEERKVAKAASFDSVVIGAGVFGTWTAWHLRKAGQAQFDPRTGRETAGQFESAVRFELMQGR